MMMMTMIINITAAAVVVVTRLIFLQEFNSLFSQVYCSFCSLNTQLDWIQKTGEKMRIYRDDKIDKENNWTLTSLNCSRDTSRVNDELKSMTSETWTAPIIRVDVAWSRKSLLMQIKASLQKINSCIQIEKEIALRVQTSFMLFKIWIINVFIL
jgi:hypothetical protein